MQILQSLEFRKNYKKLHANQKNIVDINFACPWSA